MHSRDAIVGLVICTLVGTGLIGAGPVQAAGTSDQSVTYQINVAHNGSLSGDALQVPLTKAWTRDLGGHVSYPLVAGGRVYVTATSTAIVNGNTHNATTLYALDEATGATDWTTGPVPSTYSWSGLAYDSGKVFMLTYDGGLAAIDASSGASLWTTQLSGQWSFTSPPVAANGIIYAGGAGSGGTLYAVSEASGAVLWAAPVMNGDDSSPALDASNVYVSYVGPQTYAFDQQSGSLVWHYNSGTEGGGGDTPVLSTGNLYVRSWSSTPNGFVFPSTPVGTTTVTPSGRFSASTAPAFSGNTGVFLSGSTLSAQDWTNPASPITLWTFSGDGTLDSAPVIVNNEAYVGSSSGNIYAVNLSTGHQDWSDSLGAAVLAPNDNYVGQPYPGLGAGEGTLVVPATDLVVAYRSPSSTSGVNISTVEGASFSGTVATFTDGSATAASDSARIDWGDGSPSSTGSVTQTASGSFTVSGTHTYIDEGSYPITVTITTSSSGAMTAGSTASVGDAALGASGYSLGNVQAGTVFTGRIATIQDTNPGCTSSDYTVSVDWGDGTTSSASLAPTASACNFDVSGTHTYAVATTYTIKVTATDVGGSQASTTSTVTAVVPPSTTRTTVSASNSSNPYVKLSAQAKGGTPSGSLSYDDPTTTNPTVAITSTTITAVVNTGSNTETVYGTGTQNGQSVNFTVSILGNQHSGTNTFRIQTSADYDSGVQTIASAKVS